MHLSIVTDEISDDFERALQVCHELEIDTVELRVVHGKNIVFHDKAALLQIQARLRAGNFKVCSIASPFLKSPLWSSNGPSEEQNREWELLQRSFELARLFDAPTVRTFSFLRVPDSLAVRTAVLEVIAEAVRRTEEAGLKLVLENEHACTIATGEESGWLLERIGSTTFGMTWDPGNEAALGSSPFPQGYEYVRGRVLHMHVKDVNRDLEHARREEHFVKLGAGCIDYVGQFRALAADGYEGMLSLETHYKHPTGGKEQATRESLAGLRQLLQAAGVVLQ